MVNCIYGKARVARTLFCPTIPRASVTFSSGVFFSLHFSLPTIRSKSWMGSYGDAFYGGICRMCSLRSSWPFWMDIDGTDTDDYPNPTAICGPCRVEGAAQAWCPLYPLPLEPSSMRIIWGFISRDIRRVRSIEYLRVVLLSHKRSRFRLLTYRGSGERAMFFDSNGVDLVGHILAMQ